MLNSARDDVWSGHVLAMEEGCREVGIEETMEAGGNATHVVDGSVQGHASTPWKGSDYENSGASQDTVAYGGNGVDGDVVGIVDVGEITMERQAL